MLLQELGGLKWLWGGFPYCQPSRVKIYSKALKHSDSCLAWACLDCKYMDTALQRIELVMSPSSHDIGTRTESYVANGKTAAAPSVAFDRPGA